MPQKVIVAGGAGYLGSHTVVELFKSGFEPIIVDNFSTSRRGVIRHIESVVQHEIKCHEVDITNTEKLAEALKDDSDAVAVINFAAYKQVEESVKYPLKYYHNNVAGLSSLLEVMKRLDIPHFVFSSSCAAYGKIEQFPVSEDNPVAAAESPYGRTKQVGERIIQDVIFSGELKKAVALRYFNPIGALDDGILGDWPIRASTGLVSTMMKAAYYGEEELTIYGNDYDTKDGTCIRDFLHVCDLSRAHVCALEWMLEENSSAFEAFNIGSGKGNTILEIIETFERVSKESLQYKFGERRKGDIPVMYGATDKAKKVLNWETIHTLEEAIESAWKWQCNIALSNPDMAIDNSVLIL